MIVFQVPLESIRPSGLSVGISSSVLEEYRICTASYVAPLNAQALRYEQR